MKPTSPSPALRIMGALSPAVLLGGLVVLASAFQSHQKSTTPETAPTTPAANNGAVFQAPGTPQGAPGAPAIPGQPVPGQPLPGQPIPGQPVPGQTMPGQLPPMRMGPGQMAPAQLAPAPMPAGMQGDPRLTAAFARGVEAQRKNDLTTAAAAYREVLQIQPKTVSAHINLALVLLQQKNSDRAIWHLKQAISIEPRELKPRAILAQAYINQKQPRKAYEQWVLVAGQNPTDNGQAAFTAGAIAFEQLKNPKEAERWLRKAVSLNNHTDPRVAMLFARVLTARGKASEGVGVLQTAAKKFPQITEIQTALAETQWQSGDKNGAVITLRALEKSTPANVNGGLALSQVRVMLGRALAQQKQYPEAAKALRQALANLPIKSPARIPTQNLLAQTLFSQADDEEKKGQTKNAILTWGDALQVSPNNALGYIKRGRLMDKSGDDRSALTDFNRALKLAPRDPNAIMGAASMEEKVGDPNRALAHWKTLIETQPQETQGYYNLARLGAKQRQFSSQMDYLETRVRKNPDFRAPYDAVLQVGEKAGRTDLARDWVTAMAKRYPKSSGPRNALIKFDRDHPTDKPKKTPAPVPTRTPVSIPSSTPVPTSGPKPNSTPALSISPNLKPTTKVTTPNQPEPTMAPKVLKSQPTMGEIETEDSSTPQTQ